MNGRKATGIWTFQGRDHELNVDVTDDKITVQVQDIDTADQWRATFLAKHVEDITRKTGNFKPIGVFLNMLESAVLKTSESVILQLLTYSDLENLRQRRNLSGGLGNKPPSPTSSLQSKRYLILTYSTEFDRIHYPLALPYVGKPDPVELQETVRQLQQELDKYKSKNFQRSSTSSFIRLQKKYDSLLLEKEDLERALEEMQQEMTDNCESDEGVIGLRNLVRRLEESALKEKTKFQQILSKKNEEIRSLNAEVDDLKSSERLLSSRVKSLTNEIAIMRRHSPAVTHVHSRKTSDRGRGGSGQRSGGRYIPLSLSNDHVRRRSSSLEDINVRRRAGSGTNDRIQGRGGSSSIKSRSRTPSPRVFQRFNPTAYIENKRRLQNEVDARLKKPRSRSSSAGSVGGYLTRTTPPVPRAPQSRKINLGLRSRNSSAGSSRRTSSVESLTDNGSILNESGESKLNRNTRGKRYHQQSNSSTPKTTRAALKKQRHNHSTTSQLDHSVEIKEIDARLSALQQYMKKSLR